MLYNQNNFSNERNSFIRQITSNLATPATSDPDLKSSIHSTHNNSKTLELFNKSSVVDFTIDEILNELGNESEIHNGSILLFPPRDKQEVSLSHPIAPFTSLICHKEQRREEICTTKNLSKEFKSVRFISPEERRLHLTETRRKNTIMCQLHATTHHLKPLRSKRSTHQITQVEIMQIFPILLCQ